MEMSSSLNLINQSLPASTPHSALLKIVHTCSVVSNSATPWTVVHQASLFMEFFRQKPWTQFPFPTLGDLPDPGMEPMFLPSPGLAGGFFFYHGSTWEVWSPLLKIRLWLKEVLHLVCGKGNGNPLQYSCLENPMDRAAWCRLQSMGSQRVEHAWATSLALPLPIPLHQAITLPRVTTAMAPRFHVATDLTLLLLTPAWHSGIFIPL